MEVGLFVFLSLAIGCGTASFVASRLPENIDRAMTDNELTTPENAVRFAFLATDMEGYQQNLLSSGCTCATVLIMDDQKYDERYLIAANIGDSRIVLSRSGVPERLSYVGNAMEVLTCSRITKQRLWKKFNASMLLVGWLSAIE